MMEQAVWSAVRWVGLEHVTLRREASGIGLDGFAVVVLENTPWRVHYTIDCRPDWSVTRMQVQCNDRQVALTSATLGVWEADIPGLDTEPLQGCVDVDLAVSPSTNTLPVRRLRLDPGETHELDVVYVEFPTLHLRPARQRYTRLPDVGGHPCYRYASGAFQVEFVVDAAGLVRDYPGVWHRHALPPSSDRGGIES